MKKLVLLVALFAFVAVFCSAQTAYVDGTYKASFDAMDSHGWKPFIEITVKGGKITLVNFDYVNKKGDLKTKDPAYNKSMFDIGKKTKPELYAPQLDKNLIASQKAPVDAVSGATSSSKNFNDLAVVALAKAAKGDKSETILFMNDTYTAQDKADERGYTALIEVEYKDGKIVRIAYNEYKDVKAKTGGKKEDAAYNSSMKDKTKVSWLEAVNLLVAAAIKNQGKPVDSITGASGASARFNLLLAQVVASR